MRAQIFRFFNKTNLSVVDSFHFKIKASHFRINTGG